MSCENTFNFCVAAGETFNPVFRWGATSLTSKNITAITQAAPAVVTATAYGAPDGWYVAVVSAEGMDQINASTFPPSASDWVQSTRLTADTLALSTVNSADYDAYVSGGFLVYKTPVDLSGVTGQFRVWDVPDRTGTPLVTLSVGAGITLDNTAKTISILLDTTGLTWTSGYYALDMTASAVVKRILKGTITIS